jgi:hypothetical protein
MEEEEDDEEERGKEEKGREELPPSIHLSKMLMEWRWEV